MQVDHPGPGGIALGERSPKRNRVGAHEASLRHDHHLAMWILCSNVFENSFKNPPTVRSLSSKDMSDIIEQPRNTSRNSLTLRHHLGVE
jgi:hypothetical protein